MKPQLYKYNKRFPQLFVKEKEKIKQAFKELDNFEIYHIGSTSVPGLGGKGIIDIMIAIKDWQRKKVYIEKLRKIGFRHIHPEEKGRIFLSRIRETGKGDTHIHLVKQDSQELEKHLRFRNFLRQNRGAVQEYWRLKLALLEQTKGERKTFGQLKDRYIEGINKELARQAIGRKRK